MIILPIAEAAAAQAASAAKRVKTRTAATGQKGSRKTAEEDPYLAAYQRVCAEHAKATKQQAEFKGPCGDCVHYGGFATCKNPLVSTIKFNASTGKVETVPWSWAMHKSMRQFPDLCGPTRALFEPKVESVSMFWPIMKALGAITFAVGAGFWAFL